MQHRFRVRDLIMFAPTSPIGPSERRDFDLAPLLAKLPTLFGPESRLVVEQEHGGVDVVLVLDDGLDGPELMRHSSFNFAQRLVRDITFHATGLEERLKLPGVRALLGGPQGKAYFDLMLPQERRTLAAHHALHRAHAALFGQDIPEPLTELPELPADHPLRAIERCQPKPNPEWVDVFTKGALELWGRSGGFVQPGTHDIAVGFDQQGMRTIRMERETPEGQEEDLSADAEVLWYATYESGGDGPERQFTGNTYKALDVAMAWISDCRMFGKEVES